MKTLFKILGKIFLGIIVLALIAGISLKLIFNEEIPSGTGGAPADELALKMLDAINYEQYKTAERLQWTFRGTNHYDWKPQQGKVDVTWDDYKVELITANQNESLAYENDVLLSGNDKKEAIDYAFNNFNNDSFWLVAPFKVMDPGTKREIITEDAQQKLLVRYTSGGSTPGDVYVWKLGKDYKPQNFKMWVDIIPLDGVEAKWEDWTMTDSGFPIAMKKTVFGIEIPMSDIQIE